ncbi:autophagy protein [Gaertneriomyces sp. JEL0708]|nr:autophagy protein [Gaertneriomyces sp. JEL0708]
MNIGRKSSNDLLFVNFNQDHSCISAGTRYGYYIYNVDPFGKCYSKTEGGIGIVEMLFCTSLVALVGAGEQPAFSPRRLQITNTKRQSTICELTFITAILAVKLNRKRLIVVLEEHIYIYDISNMTLLHTIDTAPNPNALCALSPSSDNCYLAYPSSSSQRGGELIIFDAIGLQAVSILQAHKSGISCVAFNYAGDLLATASDKGTVIRVHSPLHTPNSPQTLYQFRRGSYPSRIFSLSFSLDSSLLCVSSATSTVHIFKLSPQQNPYDKEKEKEKSHSLSGVLTKSLLPTTLTNMFEPERDWAFAKIPAAAASPTGSGSNDKSSPSQTICAITVPNERGEKTESRIANLMIVTSEGRFLNYSVDLEVGGEAVLSGEASLLD